MSPPSDAAAAPVSSASETAPTAAAPTAAGPPRKPLPLYFVSAPVDFLLIGGASILTFLLVRSLHSGERTDMVVNLGVWLSWVVNWPHFSATSYRLYHSRSNIAQYPVTAIAVPIFVTAFAVLSFLHPTTVAPAFVHLFLLWSPYHFSGQTVGITMIYARRAGFSVGRVERLAISSFVFGTYFLQTARGEVSGVGDFWGVRYPALGLPREVGEAAEVLLYLAGGAFAWFVVSWCVRERRILPPIVILPALAQYVWFVLGPTTRSFNEFVPFFHSLQYLHIAWAMQLKERIDGGAIQASPKGAAVETFRWFGLNVIGGAILFWLLPLLTSKIGFELPLATAVVLSAVQIHHFFVDGVIWKLKNPRVASPLLSNVLDAVRPGPAAAAPQTGHA